MYQYTIIKEDALSPQGVRRFVLSLDNHVQVMEALSAFCRAEGILCGKISGLGAINQATFRFLDPATRQYVDKTFDEQMEMTNLTGNISNLDGKVYLHVHVTASRRDYSCIGGHLLDARINGACELFVEDYADTTVGRRKDEETGLNLYQF